MQRVDLARCSFYDVSPGPVPIVDQKLIVVLIVVLEEWQGLVPGGNGPSGLSPTDISLVDNRRKRFVYLSIISSNQTRLGLYNRAQSVGPKAFHSSFDDD